MSKKKKIRIVGIVGNSRLDRSGQALLKRVVKFLEKQNVEIWFNVHAAKLLKTKRTTNKKMMDKADLVITMGGDGTLINLARDINYKNVPIYAINLGTVGFLTEIQKSEKTIDGLKRIFADRYHSDPRSMLRVTIYRKGKKIETYLALNEAVITQGNFARLIELRAEINQRRMVRFKADGVIISTPTGSTGHGLSAGGPIVHPHLDAFVFTPVCPKALAMRPIVLPSNRQVTITIETERKFQDNTIALTIDGQIITPLQYGDQIKIRRSKRHFVLARITNTKYYKMLRDKLGWGS